MALNSCIFTLFTYLGEKSFDNRNREEKNEIDFHKNFVKQ